MFPQKIKVAPYPYNFAQRVSGVASVETGDLAGMVWNRSQISVFHQNFRLSYVRLRHHDIISQTPLNPI